MDTKNSFRSPSNYLLDTFNYGQIRQALRKFSFDVWHPIVLSVLTNSPYRPSDTTCDITSRKKMFHLN